jgi:hypothetical protein
MLMRYHTGLGVGHVYSRHPDFNHQPAHSTSQVNSTEVESLASLDDGEEFLPAGSGDTAQVESEGSSIMHSSDFEIGGDGSSDEEDEDLNDEEFLEIHGY